MVKNMTRSGMASTIIPIINITVVITTTVVGTFTMAIGIGAIAMITTENAIGTNTVMMDDMRTPAM